MLPGLLYLWPIGGGQKRLLIRTWNSVTGLATSEACCCGTPNECCCHQLPDTLYVKKGFWLTGPPPVWYEWEFEVHKTDCPSPLDPGEPPCDQSSCVFQFWESSFVWEPPSGDTIVWIVVCSKANESSTSMTIALWAYNVTDGSWAYATVGDVECDEWDDDTELYYDGLIGRTYIRKTPFS